MKLKETDFVKVYGINRTSDAGPDKFAVSLFMKGCNLRCPYCMNCKLVLDDKIRPISLKKVKATILEAKPEMITISGGEPTLNGARFAYLALWLRKFYSGKIGVSSNGIITSFFTSIFSMPHVSYVTMDFKGGPEQYRSIYFGEGNAFNKVLETWEVLRETKKKKSNFDYEIRTTLYQPFIRADMIRFMSKFFIEGEKWVLQPFRPTDVILDPIAKKRLRYDEDDNEEMFLWAKENSKATVTWRCV